MKLRLPFLNGRIHLFRDPRQVPWGEWVIFPIEPDLRGCGIFGIFRIGSKRAETSSEDWERLPEIWARDFAQLSDPEVRQQWDLEYEQWEKMLVRLKQLDSFPELFRDAQLGSQIQSWVRKIGAYIEQAEQFLGRGQLSTRLQEELQARLVALYDLLWGLEKEIWENWRKIEELCASDEPSRQLLIELRQIQSLLNSLDRLEIRGRDSAGFSALIVFPSLEERRALVDELSNLNLDREWRERISLAYPTHRAIFLNPHRPSVWFSFKIAQEVGRLGDNVRFLRQEVARDRLFQLFLSQPHIRTSYLSHTRWASNGIIHLHNCHPVDNRVVTDDQKSPFVPPPGMPHPHYGDGVGYICAALNGDIDNFLSLRQSLEQEKGYQFPPTVTTDAKMVPLQIQRLLEKGFTLEEAFRQAVQSFSGSAAIAVISDLEPDKVFLSLKGSGQSIYVGLRSDSYTFASEIYGLVEETKDYLKMDGEALAHPDQPDSFGQMYVLSRVASHPLEGLKALFHRGKPIELSSEKVLQAEITTRDIDRRGFDHYFLKEISEAPQSVQKTCRGKFLLKEEGPVFLLGEEILPSLIREKLLQREIRHIYVIGQGTAGIAAMAVGAFLQRHLSPRGMEVLGLSASEMSGFHLRPQMEDSLVIAITQSGTTTDTNNAVELAKRRKAHTLAIVNRRNSDITYKVDGIFYTSDGRDVEMSVASTKAFYSQVVAGEILSLYIAQLLGTLTEEEIRASLEELLRLPQSMQEVLSEKHLFEEAAQNTAPKRRYWAITGSGWNHIAAREVRIKLSELCYKSIACDYVEDKKHIDLSSEPLILVCAAGTERRVLGDIVKDVSIFQAHKSLPIVFCDRHHVDEFRPYSQWVIPLPPLSPKGALILNTLAGHLFGYYAALAIHREGLFLQSLRSTLVELLSSATSSHLEEALRKLEEGEREFWYRLNQGHFDGSLSPSLATKIARLLQYATHKLPLREFYQEFGRAPTVQNVWQLLIEVLTEATQELLRPIDAIKHQAKTVTVGTSRLELPEGVLFEVLEQLSLSLENLEPWDVEFLKRVQPAIQEVLGYTLYELAPLDQRGLPTEETLVWVVEKAGVAKKLTSRVERPAPLEGGKRLTVIQRRARIEQGRKDQRDILRVPLLGKDWQVHRILLYHISIRQEMSLEEKVQLLSSEVREEVRTLVTEADIAWREDFWDLLSPKELLMFTPKEMGETILARLGQS